MEQLKLETEVPDRSQILRDEIETAETEAVLVLVEGLPYEYVTHDGSGGATTIRFEKEDMDRFTEAVAHITGGNVAEVIMQTIDPPAPSDPEPAPPVETDKNECVHYFTISSNKSCALCLQIVEIDPFYSVSGVEIMQNLCKCFGMVPFLRSDSAKDLILCNRCNTLLAEALDYARTLERVEQLLNTTKDCLQKILLSSCENQIKNSMGEIHETFQGGVGCFRKTLMQFWSDTTVELKKVSKIDVNEAETKPNVRKKQKLKAKNATEEFLEPEERIVIRERSSTGRTLRRTIKQPEYFKDMVSTRRSKIKFAKSTCTEGDTTSVKHCEDQVQDQDGDTEFEPFPDTEDLSSESHRGENLVPPKKRRKLLGPSSKVSKNSSNMSLENHLDLSGHGLGVKCKICDICLPNAARLKSHMRRHKKRIVLHCEPCDKSFLSSKTLIEHNENIHGASPDDNLPSSSTSCRFCNENFASAAETIQATENAMKSVKKYVCKINNCGKAYKTIQSLRQHHLRTCPSRPKRERTDGPKHECKVCSKVFATKVGLDHHTRTVHEKSFKYCCEVCGTGFQAINMLKRHVTFVHSTEKRYECEVCHMKFKRSHQLLYHKRRHTGELPFICETCGRGFVQPDKLRQHLAVHAKKETPCHLCGKYFQSKQYVTNHIRDTHIGVRKNKGSQNTVRRSKKKEENLPDQVVTEVSFISDHQEQIEQSELQEPITLTVVTESNIQEAMSGEIICEEYTYVSNS